MKGKTISILVACLIVFSLVGCVDQRPQNRNDDISAIDNRGSFFYEQDYTESNQKQLVKASRPPKLSESLERENLIRRYQFLNDQNKIFYVYLVSYGKVMAYHAAKGKISSVNSRLTQEEQIVKDLDCISEVSYEAEDGCYKVVGSPQLDGSYGTNGDGIFFFTTEGAYVEWNGEYMVSDFPLKLTTPPELVMVVS